MGRRGGVGVERVTVRGGMKVEEQGDVTLSPPE